MAMLEVVETCLSCGSHSGNIPLNCFDEATGAFMAVLVETAPVEDLISLVRDWLDQTEQDIVHSEFVSLTGSHVSITYFA